MVNKPNLFIAGFAKSGTTTLHEQLIQHPLISGGITKEPHIYASDERYAERFIPGRKYSFNTIFPEGNRFILDSSTSTLVWPGIIERIIEDTPEAKFLIIARDPLERILSHYKWMQSKGTKLKRLDQELNDGMEVNWDFNLNNNNGRFKFFWQNSMYGTHLEKLHKLVAPDKFHFMFYEDFVEHPNLEMEGIYRFLEIDPTETIAVKANKTGKGVIMPRNVKRLGKYVPGGLRRLLKNKIADIQHHKPSISEMEPIREGLSEEMVKLRELGLDTGKWQTTQSFLSDSKMVIHE